MKQHKQAHVINIIFTLICFNTFHAYAIATPPYNNEITLKKISATCVNSPYNCLKNIDRLLDNTSPNSRIFFELLQYKYEALFNLQKTQSLYKETKQWLNQPELPFLFQISNAIYFAKTAIRLELIEEGMESYQFAKSLLGQMNKEYPSPIRLVQFANLQMQIDEFEQAYELLSSLKQKYANSPDAYFMLELNGNLAHAANQLGKKELALLQWQETVKWAEIYGNQQQLAVVLFNLADIYEQLKQYPKAANTFAKANTIATQAGDTIKANQANYHLVRVFIKQRQYCQAKTLYQSIDVNILPNKAIYPFTSIQSQLTLCQ
ncbi:tetratricopeptide repeat protein [Thalassotalea sp. G2M2-11]|uniref:tetratricopeptide repeat protein n=1 Tax=Thalassotalea sp. G2M2-11 TaxID=2787627 RepID=UPI0019D05C06|nr:tetratricopeptide repeat protein [Thalassotalea sp. G2M2-11]